MAALDIQIIKKNGKKEYVVMPYKEFLKMQEELDDYESLRILREAKRAEKNASTIGIEELKTRMKIRTRKASKP
ncbi:MAG: type II toxin-antitoxin system Phd/YefM family antitoxin [Chloroflexi bacterium]|nr:type II toxin-antitoxin system Phd/YefM family antitoxin [Chloroflexota bacterium]